jgi:hypothetical protein
VSLCSLSHVDLPAVLATGNNAQRLQVYLVVPANLNRGTYRVEADCVFHGVVFCSYAQSRVTVL